MKPPPISARWRHGQIKNIADVTLGKMLQSSNSGDDIEANYMRAANVQPEGVLQLDPKLMWFKPGELESLSLRQGDVVVVEGGVGGYGRAAYVPADLQGWGFQNSINRLRPVGENDGRFLTYYLIALRASGFIERYCNVVSMPHLTAEKLAAIPIPIPEVIEQRAIANFLDRETARIDTLIEEQQRLIDLLLDRRQSIIETTVFTGLDGGETKDPTEPWLPTLPVNWTTTQLGFVSDTTAGWAFPSDGFTQVESDVRLLRGVNVKPGGTDWSDMMRWNQSDNAVPDIYQLIPGDLVLGMDRPFVGGGVRIAVLTTDDVPSLLVQRVMRIRPSAVADPGYFRYILESSAFWAYLEPLFTGVSVPHVSEWQVRKFRMPLPPLVEQRRIAAHIEEKTTKIDLLVAEAERFVELASERRTALITAAVTGQIDVRDEVA